MTWEILQRELDNNRVEKMDRINAARANYESLDDQSLINKFNASTGEDKMAIGLILKARNLDK
jgi:hypothetical protein